MRSTRRARWRTRAAMGRSRTTALGSPDVAWRSSREVNAGTSIRRSSRSSTGPLTRTVCCRSSVGVHLHPRFGWPSQPQKHRCVAFLPFEAGRSQTANSPKGSPARSQDPRGPHPEETTRPRASATNPGRAAQRPGGDPRDVGERPGEAARPPLQGDRLLPRPRPSGNRRYPGPAPSGGPAATRSDPREACGSAGPRRRHRSGC